MASRRNSSLFNHDDSVLMIPPPGFKFIPRYKSVCGKPGCFECFDIYCERCESKDRRIVELEMRNNDLAKYITQLQGKLFGSTKGAAGSALYNQVAQQQRGYHQGLHEAPQVPGGPMKPGIASQNTLHSGGTEPFAYIQSPVLYDPTLNLSYVATTSFAPVSPQNDK